MSIGSPFRHYIIYMSYQCSRHIWNIKVFSWHREYRKRNVFNIFMKFFFQNNMRISNLMEHFLEQIFLTIKNNEFSTDMMKLTWDIPGFIREQYWILSLNYSFFGYLGQEDLQTFLTSNNPIMENYVKSPSDISDQFLFIINVKILLPKAYAILRR